MGRTRHTIRLPRELSSQLELQASRNRVTQNRLVQTAIESFLSADNPERMEAALTRRLDSVVREVKQLKRDLEISNEALGLFIHFWLTTTSALPPAERDAARAAGSKRYSDFIIALSNRMGSRNSFVSNLSEAMEVHTDD